MNLGVPDGQIVLAAEQTLYMVFVSLAIGTAIAMVLAVLLVLTGPNGIMPHRWPYRIINTVVNIVRSIPFIILLVFILGLASSSTIVIMKILEDRDDASALYGRIAVGTSILQDTASIILLVFILPLTKAIVGTRIGTTAALVPLVVFIAPYLTRLFENSLLEVKQGIIEAAQAMGASYFEIVWYFLLPEAKGSLILSVTTGTIGLLGATAMAGAIGAGGVGDLALTYGYERLNCPLMLFTVIVLIIFVQIIQTIGNHYAAHSRGH